MNPVGSSRGTPNYQACIDGSLSGDLPGYQHCHIRECVAPGFPDTPLGAWLLGLFQQQADRLPGASIAQIFRARAGCDLTDRLHKLTVPTLLVEPARRDTALASGKRTASLIPGARHVTIEGAGHACPIERPREFDTAVIRFLAGNGLWNGPSPG